MANGNVTPDKSSLPLVKFHSYYKFDHDWFSGNIPNLLHIYENHPYLYRKKWIKILEIGAFEGRSTVFFLTQWKNTVVTTIDTWEGGADHDPNNPEIDFHKVWNNFCHNVKHFEDRLSRCKATSRVGLSLIQADMINSNVSKFDIAYVDGSHEAADVLEDLIRIFPMMNINGVIYCDDYYWGFNDVNNGRLMRNNPMRSPKLGIDAFVNTYREKLIPVAIPNNHAIAFVKVSE